LFADLGWQTLSATLLRYRTLPIDPNHKDLK